MNLNSLSKHKIYIEDCGDALRHILIDSNDFFETLEPRYKIYRVSIHDTYQSNLLDDISFSIKDFSLAKEYCDKLNYLWLWDLFQNGKLALNKRFKQQDLDFLKEKVSKYSKINS